MYPHMHTNMHKQTPHTHTPHTGELSASELDMLLADDALRNLTNDMRALASLGLLSITIDPSNTKR